MIGFAIRYAVWVGALFFLLFFDGLSPLFIVNQLQTGLTIHITHLWVSIFDLPVHFQAESLLLDNGMHLKILHECNGLTPYLLLAAAILAYPTSLQSKALWLLIGYCAVLVINTLRMLFITLVVIDHPEQFHLVHDWIGRYSVALLTLGLFYLYTNYVRIIQKKTFTG